jgi:hypothetical protein
VAVAGLAELSNPGWKLQANDLEYKTTSAIPGSMSSSSAVWSYRSVNL